MAFKWDKIFETGVEIIDQQHQGLVALINDAAPFLTSPQGLDLPRIEQLIDQLFACEAPFSSPAGKPTFIAYELEEIRKRFAEGG